jgi:chorismate mutase
MEIKKIRKEIDKIDDKILTLLSKRKNLVKDIARLKKELKIPIFDKKREEQIIERLKIKSKENNLDENFVISIYDIILKNSKDAQEDIINSLK